MTENDPGSDGINNPAWRSDLLARFRENTRAQHVWSRQAPNPRCLPDVFVACSDGTVDLEGVVIGGRFDPDNVPAWDLTGTFTVFDAHGAILDVNGWLATDLETVTHASVEEQ